MSHDDYESLAVGHVLDALEPDEYGRFVDHLPGCLTCQDSLVALEAVTGHLAGQVPLETPPPELRARLLGALDGIPSVVPAVGVADDAGPVLDRSRVGGLVIPRERAGRRAEPTSPSGRRTGRSGDGMHRSGLRPPGKARVLATRLVGAAAVLALVLGLGGFGLHERHAARQASQAAAGQARVASLLAQPKTRVVALLSTKGGASGAAVLGASQALLVVRLPSNDTRSSQYVLWQVRGQAAPTPVRSFDVTSTGVDVVDVPADAGGAGMVYAISYEKGRVPPRTPTDLVLRQQA